MHLGACHVDLAYPNPVTESTFEGGDVGVPTAEATGVETAQKSNAAGTKDWFDYSPAAGGAQLRGLRTIDDLLVANRIAYDWE